MQRRDYRLVRAARNRAMDLCEPDASDGAAVRPELAVLRGLILQIECGSEPSPTSAKDHPDSSQTVRYERSSVLPYTTTSIPSFAWGVSEAKY